MGARLKGMGSVAEGPAASSAAGPSASVGRSSLKPARGYRMSKTVSMVTVRGAVSVQPLASVAVSSIS